ncbi:MULTISPECIES: hypothetical protein [Peribacillus]|nr:hypothetical protein [Peribacillus sp. BBB004]
MKSLVYKFHAHEHDSDVQYMTAHVPIEIREAKELEQVVRKRDT